MAFGHLEWHALEWPISCILSSCFYHNGSIRNKQECKALTDLLFFFPDKTLPASVQRLALVDAEPFHVSARMSECDTTDRNVVNRDQSLVAKTCFVKSELKDICCHTACLGITILKDLTRLVSYNLTSNYHEGQKKIAQRAPEFI